MVLLQSDSIFSSTQFIRSPKKMTHARHLNFKEFWFSYSLGSAAPPEFRCWVDANAMSMSYSNSLLVGSCAWVVNVTHVIRAQHTLPNIKRHTLRTSHLHTQISFTFKVSRSQSNRFSVFQFHSEWHFHCQILVRCMQPIRDIVVYQTKMKFCGRNGRLISQFGILY